MVKKYKYRWDFQYETNEGKVYQKWMIERRELRIMTISQKLISIEIYDRAGRNLKGYQKRKRQYQPTDSETIEAAYQAGFEPSNDVIAFEKRFKAELLKEATKFLLNITKS